jgi:hypothetical protein
MTQDNRQTPRRVKNARGLRQAVKRETRGGTRNLRENFTERDWSRMEAAAKRAMANSNKRMGA